MKNILLIFLMLFSLKRVYSSSFQLSSLQDDLWLGSGIALNLSSLYLESVQSLLTPQQISSLNVQDIIPIDRWVTGLWSVDSSRASDGFMISSALLPFGLLAFSEVRKEWLVQGVMYLEAFLLNEGVTGLLKGLTARTRPYAYNPVVDLSMKLSGSTVRSFISGHTSSAFTGAMYMSTVFSLYYPHSPWRIPVIIGSFALATTTGILRITAGKHFLTDVIVGAFVGTLSGWIIPFSHFSQNTKLSLSFSEGDCNGTYMVYRF